MKIKDNPMLERTIIGSELPKRSDDEYIRIEQFKKYEYTHCATYEFARRNDYVEHILNLLYELFAYYEQIILPLLTKYEKAIITDDILESKTDVENIYKDFFIGLLNHYDKKCFVVDFENLTFENIKDKVSYLVHTLAKELYDKYYIIYQYTTEDGNNKFCDIYNLSEYLERDKTLREYIETKYGNEMYLKKDNKLNYDANKYFTIFQDVDIDKNGFSFSTIYPNFNTALRDFTDTKIALNLSLPKDEIVDYIEKIKNDYDSKNSIIKTPIQILEENLEEDVSYENIDKSVKWADNLFIYDYYRICNLNPDKREYKIIQEIQLELTKFHGLKVKKDLDEIKNRKDTKYKQISWDDYIKDNSETNETNIYFEKDEKPYLSTKAIANKYKIIKNYIEGDNPKYKTLIDKVLSK